MADWPTDDRPRHIAVSKLLFDQFNARLGDPQPDQQETILALADLLGPQLLRLAQDILIHGTDRSSSLIVTTEGAPAGKYRVLEGNRRLLAIKALVRPRIVADVLTPVRFKRLTDMSTQFHDNPIRKLWCVIYEAEEEAEHWIELRHTGANNGVGLVEWNSNDQDRWKSRHGDPTNRKEAGQVLDFVDRLHPPLPDDNRKIFSTLQRIIVARSIKDKLGIEIKSRIVYSYFPGPEVMKGLAKVVRDLRSGRIKVTDVYHSTHRDNYIEQFKADELPDPATRLTETVVLSKLPLGDLDTQSCSASEASSSSAPTENDNGANSTNESAAGGSSEPAGEYATSTSAPSENPGNGQAASGGARKSRVKPLKPRSTTIPANCFLWIQQPRINAIYRELTALDVDSFTNACAVTLRVFVELSVDHHIAVNKIMPEAVANNLPLAKRLKELARFLRTNGRIGEQLEKAIIKVADGTGLFSASTTTFNQYVHNQFAYPQPTELRTAWDELEPFMLALWVR
ncbi:hypothetical protein [Nonomuraea sp. NPDC005650]|uniref:hypothetical protein n=1 Tax=Nonomuraea sp. NPDC005650 TaxID=3157045 RepID=UPI0033A234E9